MNSSEIGEDDASLQRAAAKGKSVNLGFRLCPIDAEQVLDCLRKKNADDQPLPPNNIIEFNLGGYDVEILKGGPKGWYCCWICGTKFAPFSGVIKELVSHRTSKTRWLLFEENGGLTNLEFDDAKSIDEFAFSVPGVVEFEDVGQRSKILATFIYCTNCFQDVGIKIIEEHNNHPIIRPGRYILEIFWGREIIYWERPKL